MSPLAGKRRMNRARVGALIAELKARPGSVLTVKQLAYDAGCSKRTAENALAGKPVSEKWAIAIANVLIGEYQRIHPGQVLRLEDLLVVEAPPESLPSSRKRWWAYGAWAALAVLIVVVAVRWWTTHQVVSGLRDLRPEGLVDWKQSVCLERSPGGGLEAFVIVRPVVTDERWAFPVGPGGCADVTFGEKRQQGARFGVYVALTATAIPLGGKLPDSMVPAPAFDEITVTRR